MKKTYQVRSLWLSGLFALLGLTIVVQVLRIQQQWAISFIAVIAMLALLAGLYLNITATASIAGRHARF